MSSRIVVETRAISVDRFRVKDGQPTCAAGVSESMTCRFLTFRFGMKAACCIDGAALRRDNDDYGYLIPHEDCIVWKERA